MRKRQSYVSCRALPCRALYFVSRRTVGGTFRPRPDPYVNQGRGSYVEENQVKVPGVTVSDWVQAIMGLLDNREGQGNGR